ncbi:hypothetical protein FOA52_001320 [Chlamydomonas sp. UWO 241]|nr:hypothetical protein FOA52_001320 [Chlamydomonas sp. UWO 241]
MPPADDDAKLEILANYVAFVFSLDGTLWNGNELVPGVSEMLDLLRYQGKKLFFVTNDATLSRQSHLKKFQALGLKVSLEEIYGSAFAAAAFLKSKKFQRNLTTAAAAAACCRCRRAYVVGEAGLMEELRGMGIEALGGPGDAKAEVDFRVGEPYVEVDPDVGAVVVGLDRHLNYYKVQYSLTCLLENKDCLFLATNTDSRSNFSQRQEWAGAGTMVGALIGASEAEPLVVGKPSPLLLDSICRASGLTKDQMCIVGDRLDTDVLWGSRNGCGTLLVLSGATSEAMLLAPDNKVHPTYYMDSIGAMLTIKDKLSACVIS